MTNCRHMRRRIERVIEGKLVLEEAFELEEHARTCPRCGKALAEARALEEALLAMPAPPAERLDVERSLDRIHARLDEQGTSERPSSRGRDRRRDWTIGVAAAAALVLVVVGIRARLDPGEEPAPAGRETSAVDVPPVPEDDVAGTSPTVAAPGAAVEDVPAPPTFDPLAWATDYDGTRHAWAREEIATILRECGTVLTENEVSRARAAFLAEFDERSRPLATAGWPVLRLVQHFVTDSDAELARVAACYVGARGDRGALHELALVLERADRKRAAALALAGAGGAGLEELRAAYWDPDLAPIVLGALDRTDATLVIPWIERVLREARALVPSEEHRGLAVLLSDRLTGLGAEAAPIVLALADHPLLDRTAVLDAFARTRGASELIVQRVRSSKSSSEDELLLEALARLPAAECFDWVVRRSRGTKSSTAALHALAHYPGYEPALALLDLRTASSRDDDPAEVAAWCEALEVDSTRFVSLAEDTVLLRDPSRMRRLLEVLVLTEHPAAAPALLALAARADLGDEDREHAVLAAGEFGSSSDTTQIEELVAALAPSEARLAAAAAWSVFVLAGESGVRSLLAAASPDLVASVLDRFSAPNARARRTSTLFQLARLLEPWLERRNPIAKDTR
jgi:hypothetical protein